MFYTTIEKRKTVLTLRNCDCRNTNWCGNCGPIVHMQLLLTQSLEINIISNSIYQIQINVVQFNKIFFFHNRKWQFLVLQVLKAMRAKYTGVLLNKMRIDFTRFILRLCVFCLMLTKAKTIYQVGIKQSQNSKPDGGDLFCESCKTDTC